MKSVVSAPSPRRYDPLTEPLPWLQEPLRLALTRQRGHAVLAVAPPGIGQIGLALDLARAWLCEDRSRLPAAPACGQCASCQMIAARTHPDLLLVLPQAEAEALGWFGGDEGEEGEASESRSKAKASSEIKVDAVRRIVTFAQQTTARGGAKVVVLHPAEQMNTIAANTLLKTLEEPPGQARFVLCSAAADRLLPTVRSRCQALPLSVPDATVSTSWLRARGVSDPETLLAAAGGQPLSALELATQGLDGAAWLEIPRQVLAGQTSGFAGWSVARVVDALQKLAIDAMRIASGHPPWYFPSVQLPKGASILRLTAWAAELRQTRRHAEHPWNAPLQINALVARACAALQST